MTRPMARNLLPIRILFHATLDSSLAALVGIFAAFSRCSQVHPTGLVDPNEPEVKFKFLAVEALSGVGGLLLDNTDAGSVGELGKRNYITGKMAENGKVRPPSFKMQRRPFANAHPRGRVAGKHFVGRGLMKHIESGIALAKRLGLHPKVLAGTFSKYNDSVRTKTDPFGMKYFAEGEWSTKDYFNVAVMTPALHCTMGGLEIDAESRVLSTTQPPILGPPTPGSVYGANMLRKSSLLGCAVFGR
ncbi:succinate dehydrogenase/fumarate reductase flavo protein, partial [Athelia psychrophila]